MPSFPIENQLTRLSEYTPMHYEERSSTPALMGHQGLVTSPSGVDSSGGPLDAMLKNGSGTGTLRTISQEMGQQR